MTKSMRTVARLTHTWFVLKLLAQSLKLTTVKNVDSLTTTTMNSFWDEMELVPTSVPDLTNALVAE